MLSTRSLSLLILGSLAWLLLLSFPVEAAPTGIASFEVLSRADKPFIPTSKEELRKEYFKKGPKKDKSCFFTRMDVENGKRPAQNTADTKKQCKSAGLTTLDANGIWKKNNILQFGEWANTNQADFTNLNNWVSEIFAEETSGVAYLFLSEQKDDKTGEYWTLLPNSERIFYKREYAAMRDSGKVDKIMHVKFFWGGTPSIPDPAGDDNVYWKKGDSDPPTEVDEIRPQPAPAPEPEEEPAVSLTCAGTGENKYVNREGIIKVIDTFCEEAEKQGVLDTNSGSIARTYNRDTPEEVDIALDWQPGLNWAPWKSKCVEQLMIITDSCDTTSNHWKAGGSRKDTDVTYRWNPVNARSVPVEDATVWGGCQATTGGYYTIWGAHWAADDFGKELHRNIKGKGISPTQWEFEYGGGDDHREWTAHFQTIIHAWPQVEKSMESVGGWDLDIRCDIG